MNCVYKLCQKCNKLHVGCQTIELHEISLSEPNSLDFCMKIHVVSKLNKFHTWDIILSIFSSMNIHLDSMNEHHIISSKNSNE